MAQAAEGSPLGGHDRVRPVSARHKELQQVVREKKRCHQLQGLTPVAESCCSAIGSAAASSCRGSAPMEGSSLVIGSVDALLLADSLLPASQALPAEERRSACMTGAHRVCAVLANSERPCSVCLELCRGRTRASKRLASGCQGPRLATLEQDPSELQQQVCPPGHSLSTCTPHCGLPQPVGHADTGAQA